MAKPGTELKMACPANTGNSAQRLEVGVAEPVVDGPSKTDEIFMTAPACFIRQ
jgi:hypothetical protein